MMFLRTTIFRWSAMVALASGCAHAQQPQPTFVPSGEFAASAKQPLIPAALGLRTDKKGNSWNFQQSGTLGRIGSSMMNTGLALYINGKQFYSQQPLMTQDGKEFILPTRSGANFGGLFITRRVLLNDQGGIVRYLEVFHNPTAQEVSAKIELRTNFSGNYQQIVSNEGNTGIAVLQNKETGVLVTPAATNQRSAFVFSFRSEHSHLNPTLSSQSRYMLSANFQIRIPAGETSCLLHTISQVPIPSALDRNSVVPLFKPVTLERQVGNIPKDLRSKIANFTLNLDTQGMALLSSTSIDSLEVTRGRKDVLAVGESTRLLGTSSCSKIAVKTAYGQTDVAFDDLAAVVGGNQGKREQHQLFLRGGQVVGGTVAAEGLRFTLHSGNEMELEIEKLDRLLRPIEEGFDSWPLETVAMLETQNGDRLALLASERTSLSFVSPWGSVEVSLKDILSISAPEADPVGHQVLLKNGSRFFAFTTGDEFVFETPLFGTQQIAPSEVRAIVSRESAESPPSSGITEWQSPRLTEPYVNLAGQQRLVGRLLTEKLTLLTEGEEITLAPETIRLLANLNDEFAEANNPSPPFRADLWGGGVVEGSLRDRAVSLQFLNSTWEVPARDIRQVIVPNPQITNETNTVIGRWIQQLGEDDWKTRERASEELAEFGFLAKPRLIETLKLSCDPEVLRRAELLLQRLE